MCTVHTSWSKLNLKLIAMWLFWRYASRFNIVRICNDILIDGVNPVVVKFGVEKELDGFYGWRWIICVLTCIRCVCMDRIFVTMMATVPRTEPIPIVCRLLAWHNYNWHMDENFDNPALDKIGLEFYFDSGVNLLNTRREFFPARQPSENDIFIECTYVRTYIRALVRTSKLHVRQ